MGRRDDTTQVPGPKTGRKSRRFGGFDSGKQVAYD
jgi:hypothetical protein